MNKEFKPIGISDIKCKVCDKYFFNFDWVPPIVHDLNICRSCLHDIVETFETEFNFKRYPVPLNTMCTFCKTDKKLTITFAIGIFDSITICNDCFNKKYDIIEYKRIKAMEKI